MYTYIHIYIHTQPLILPPGAADGIFDPGGRPRFSIFEGSLPPPAPGRRRRGVDRRLQRELGAGPAAVSTRAENGLGRG